MIFLTFDLHKNDSVQRVVVSLEDVYKFVINTSFGSTLNKNRFLSSYYFLCSLGGSYLSFNRQLKDFSDVDFRSALGDVLTFYLRSFLQSRISSKSSLTFIKLTYLIQLNSPMFYAGVVDVNFKSIAIDTDLNVIVNYFDVDDHLTKISR